MLALLAAACAPKAPEQPPRLTLAAAAFSDLPGWTADNAAEALPALTASCGRILAQPADRPLGFAGKPADWRAPCAALAAVPPGDADALRTALKTGFTPYAAGNNGERTGLFTGYYEAELHGARTPGGRYAVPLYARPDDLVMVDLGDFRDTLRGERIAGRVVDGRLRPYEDRAAIENGALRGKLRELFWVDDPVGAFFLHIQGSGRILLPDGSVQRVGYAGQNGQPYVAIGRFLVERGDLKREDVSMQSIRAWLAAHPAEAPALMNRNPSYVFFKPIDGDAPLGAQGVPLTPGRSLAIDRSLIPFGLPVWLDAADPLDGNTRLQRLLVAQDTGGAIRGPVRGDVFWGHGKEAERRAGVMRSQGQYWFLLPKTVAPPPLP